MAGGVAGKEPEESAVYMLRRLLLLSHPSPPLPFDEGDVVAGEAPARLGIGGTLEAMDASR